MAALLQPLDQTNSAVAARADRPLSIKVLGIMSLAIGALGTLGCGMFALKDGLTVYGKGGLPVSAEKIIPYPQGLLIWSLIVAALDLLTSAALVYGAISALRFLPWARTFMVRLSVIIVLLAIAKCVVSLSVHREEWVDVRKRALAQYTAEERKNFPADAEQQIEKMSRSGPLISLGLQASVPVLILLFWTRRSVKDGYERAFA